MKAQRNTSSDQMLSFFNGQFKNKYKYMKRPNARPHCCVVFRKDLNFLLPWMVAPKPDQPRTFA